MLEILAATAAKAAIGKMLSWGVTKLLPDNKNTYISELTDVIIDTCKQFESLCPVAEQERLPFYHSQIIIEEFVKFRFTKQFDTKSVLQAIRAENKIIVPSEEQLNQFFDLFIQNVNKTEILKKLNIEFNYKEEIFNISSELKEARNEIKSELQDIKSLLRSPATTENLAEEWNDQLTEVNDYIEQFKVKSAIDRLEKLEQRIREKGWGNKVLLSKLLYLKTQCMQLMEHGVTREHATLLLEIYELQPLTLRNISNASLAHTILNNDEKAEQLADQVLSAEPFNIIGWTIKMYLAKEQFENKLKDVPIVVKERVEFVTVLFHWLRSHGYIQSIHDFKSLGLSLNIDFSTPVRITPANLNLHHVIAEFLMYEYFGDTMLIRSDLSYPNTESNKELMQAFRIYEISMERLKGSEIEDKYQLSTFYFYCLSLMMSGNIEHVAGMEKAYNQIEKAHLDITLKMMQAYNCSGQKSDVAKAIAILDAYTGPKNELLHLFKAGNYAILGDKENKTKEFIEYLNNTFEITRAFVINFTSFIWHQGVLPNYQLADAVTRILTLTSKVHEGYTAILKYFSYFKLNIGIYTNDEISDLIELAEKLIDPADVDISMHVAMGFVMKDDFERALNYLEPHINFNEASEPLKLYCKILYKVDGKKVKLLELLKRWRLSFEPEYELLKIEQYLLQVQNEWQEATTVAEYGIKSFHAADVFVHGLFVSLYKGKLFDKVRANSFLVHNRTFTDEGKVVNIANVLIAAECFQEAIDFLFLHASSRKNPQCRSALAMLSSKFPSGYFCQFSVAEVGHFVKYRAGDVTQIIELTNENRDSIPAKYLIGRSIGESFSVTGNFSGKPNEITIERIMDKYVSLMDEIVEEARNPLSGMGLLTFSIDPKNPASLLDSLRENMGLENTLERERTDAELEKFHQGIKTFTEITGSVFNRNYVEAYFALTSMPDKPFKAISAALNKSVINNDTVFICDFTSALLFFELHKNNQFDFNAPLQIPRSIYSSIELLLEETKSNPFPRMSVSFYHDNIIPHFYNDDSKEKKITALQEILIWLETHCTIEKLPEIIEFVSHLPAEDQQSPYMRSIMECRLMADKENYILVTNDLFYSKYFQLSPNKLMSPSLYLEYKYPNDMVSSLNFMLSRNYVGIPITSEMLKTEFLNFLADKSNKYVICLENLRLGWNPDRRIIVETVKFLKELYLTSIISGEKRASSILTVFQHLTTQMTRQYGEILTAELRREFSLLSHQLTELSTLLVQAVRMR